MDARLCNSDTWSRGIGTLFSRLCLNLYGCVDDRPECKFNCALCLMDINESETDICIYEYVMYMCI